MRTPEDILSFWFGDLDPDEPVPADRSRLWFGGVAETDRLIRDRFLDDVRRAATSGFPGWRRSPHGTLALILLLDQFPRNIFRGTPEAFATDGQALALALAGIGSGLDRELKVVERAFFYLPLEHAENIDMQQKSVAVFRGLIAKSTPAQRPLCESFYDYALRHRDVIARFGRFPHRNAILGRVSTPEEVEFLKQPGSSF